MMIRGKMTIQKHWGARINMQEKSLPVLKFNYIKNRIMDSDIKVLEIGCGNGKILNSIKDFNPSARCYGCDIQKPTVNVDFNFKLIKKNQPLPYKDKFFDVVVLMDIIEHVKDYKFLISEVKRVMKSTSWLCGFCPVEGQPISAYSFYKLIFGRDLYIRTKEHVNAFKRRELIDMFQCNFNGGEFHYSYHTLGQLMDATLFMLMQNDWVAKKFWNDNKYYNEDSNKKSIFNRLLTIANAIAYYESRFMMYRKFTSAGLHFAVRNFEYAPECYDVIGYPFNNYDDDRWKND